MPANNSNISSKKLKQSLREFIWDTIILRKIFSNPFIVSIFILLIIWLLDLMYGKTFQCANKREIIQHILTTYVVVSLGIVLNNLTIKNISGGEEMISQNIPEPEYPGMNKIISEYIE